MAAKYCIFETDRIALLGVKLDEDKDYHLATASRQHLEFAAQLYRKACSGEDLCDPFTVFMNVDNGMIAESDGIGNTHTNVALIMAQPITMEEFVTTGCRNADIEQGEIPIFHNSIRYTM